MKLEQSAARRTGWGHFKVPKWGQVRVPFPGVDLAVGQPALARLSAGVEVGEAPADDERPDLVPVLGQLEI